MNKLAFNSFKPHSGTNCDGNSFSNAVLYTEMGQMDLCSQGALWLPTLLVFVFKKKITGYFAEN